MMQRNSIDSARDMIYSASCTKHAVNGMKLLKLLRNITESTWRTLIMLLPSTLKALARSTDQSIIMFWATLIKLKFQGCSVIRETSRDCKSLWQCKRNQSYTNGGLNILKHRVLWMTRLTSTKKLLTTVLLWDSYVWLEIFLMLWRLPWKLTSHKPASILLATTSRTTIWEKPSFITPNHRDSLTQLRLLKTIHMIKK